MTTVETKRCVRCGQTKDADCFYPERKASDGMMSWCISCCHAYKRTPENRAKDRARHARNRGPTANQ